MPRAKISEFSTIPGDNTDIDGINIAEGCAPSGINDAIRELMAQLKDFQSGAAGDNITVVGTLAAKGTSSSGADLKLYEDTDNGTNYVGFIAPASIASNVQWTLPSADGSSGQALQTNGSGTLSFATLGISAGGTGQTTANAAFNALAPSQTSNAGRYLKTDGTNTSWDLLDISTADITGTLPVANGGTGITSFGTGVATALGINVGSSGAFVTNGGALGTPSSGTVTNLTGTASININGTVGATTPNTGSFTTLTTSSTVTINGGTANGVAYLNGSKVLTTGSALVYDGTILRVNGSTTSGLRLASSSGASNGFNLYNDSSTDIAYLMNFYNGSMVFGVNNAEQMRLTSTGLGIGTSSPTVKLDVNGSIAIPNSTQAYQIKDTGGTGRYVMYYSDGVSPSSGNNLLIGNTLNNAVIFFSNNTERMRLDSSGNLGLGVQPSAWGGADAIEAGLVGNYFIGSTATSYTSIGTASYYDGSVWRYARSTGASKYELLTNTHAWFTAPSGTAGNTISFTQAMTLTAGGNLLVGTTTDSTARRMRVYGSEASAASTSLVLQNSSSGTTNSDGFSIELDGTSAYVWNYENAEIRIGTNNTERARITSGGDLLVGTTSAVDTGKISVLFNNSSVNGIGVKMSSTTYNNNVLSIVNPSNTQVGYIYANATTTTYSTSSDYRLKQDIAPMTGALAKVAALKPCTYKWKADGSDGEGFIAHELAEVVPQCVTGEKDAVDAEGKPIYQGIDTSFLVATLTAAIQEQQALINDLRARVAALESQA